MGPRTAALLGVAACCATVVPLSDGFHDRGLVMLAAVLLPAAVSAALLTGAGIVTTSAVVASGSGGLLAGLLGVVAALLPLGANDSGCAGTAGDQLTILLPAAPTARPRRGTCARLSCRIRSC